MIAVSNTSPLSYLILLGHTDLLPTLFGQVVIPAAVHAELRDPRAPQAIQAWIAARHARSRFGRS